MNVLVIEDDELLADVLVDMLGQLGHQAVLARHAQEGLECLVTADYDLVFVDSLVPDGGGMELARQVQSDPRLRGTALVLVCARSEVPADPTSACAVMLPRQPSFADLARFIDTLAAVSRHGAA